MTKADVNVKDICPAARAPRITSPSPTIPATKLFYVATNHICMDYQAFSVKYKGGFPYVGAILSMYPADHGDVRGRLVRVRSRSPARPSGSINDMFQDYSGPLTTDGGVLSTEHWTGGSGRSMNRHGKVLYQFHAPSGIIGNPITYMHNGKQYVAVLTGVGGWAAIGLAEGLTKGIGGLGRGRPDCTRWPITPTSEERWSSSLWSNRRAGKSS